MIFFTHLKLPKNIRVNILKATINTYCNVFAKYEYKQDKRILKNKRAFATAKALLYCNSILFLKALKNISKIAKALKSQISSHFKAAQNKKRGG